jgi:GNAT superfamily N-acetyltransferase
VTAPDLARLEHENLIASFSMAGSIAPGGLVRHDRGATLILTGAPLLLFNQVLVDPAGTTDAAIADAVAEARARAIRCVVNLRIGADDGHAPLMADLGLVPVSKRPWMPGMARSPITSGPKTPGELDIRRVADAAGVRAHIETASAGFEVPASVLGGVLTADLLGQPAARVYVGYVGGVPVTTGLGVRTGDTIGVYNIATIPSHRRRGYGQAMTSRVEADGHDEGCTVAVLQASDMGHPIYQRMGYRTVVEYMGYAPPA